MPSRFDRFVQGPDNILTTEVELAVLVYPLVEILTKSFTGDGKIVAIDEIALQEEMKNFCIGKNLREKNRRLDAGWCRNHGKAYWEYRQVCRHLP